MIDVANQIAQAWWSWMGPMLWQVSLLILIVGTIDLLIARWAWPQVRYALWLLVLVKLLIPPTWSLPSSVVSQSRPWVQQRMVQMLDGERLPGADAQTASPRVSSVDAGPGFSEASAPPPGAGARPSPSSSPVAARPVWQVYAMGIWILGMALFAVLLGSRIARLRRWHREHDEQREVPVWFHELLVQTAQRLELGRLPAIVFSDEAVTPAVYGVFRPVLLLPAGYTESISREDAEHVLLHELAHLKRGDLWLHGLLLLLQIVYWFNPLLIWVRKQTKHVREICCDLTIANVLREKTRHYRQTLLDTARKLLTETVEPGMGLLGVFEEPFRLVTRLRWLERETWHSRRWVVLSVIGVVLIMVPLVLPMAAVESRAAATQRAAATVDGSAALDAGFENGDLFLREETRMDGYFWFLRSHSEVLYETETWIGERRMATHEPRKSRIIDLDRNVFYVINHLEETYVELPLPVDTTAHLSPDVARERRRNQFGMRVEGTGKTRKILDRRCNEYDLTSWEIHDGVRSDYTEAKVWTTTDVAFDVELFHELVRNTRRTLPWTDEARQELEKIMGFQVAYERVGYDRWFVEKRMVTEFVELERRQPAADAYSVPAGYTRKDHFTRDDF